MSRYAYIHIVENTIIQKIEFDEVISKEIEQSYWFSLNDKIAAVVPYKYLITFEDNYANTYTKE